MPIVHQRAAARRDLIDRFIYLAEHASVDTAERLLVQARTTFDDVAREPKIGAPLALKPPELVGRRKSRVNDFDHSLIMAPPSLRTRPICWRPRVSTARPIRRCGCAVNRRRLPIAKGHPPAACCP